MNIDAILTPALIEAFGMPAALVVAVVVLMLKYPPRPPVTPDADLLAELRRVTAALQALKASVDTLAPLPAAQAKLIDEIGDLATTIAVMNDRLAR